MDVQYTLFSGKVGCDFSSNSFVWFNIHKLLQFLRSRLSCWKLCTKFWSSVHSCSQPFLLFQLNAHYMLNAYIFITIYLLPVSVGGNWWCIIYIYIYIYIYIFSILCEFSWNKRSNLFVKIVHFLVFGRSRVRFSTA